MIDAVQRHYRGATMAVTGASGYLGSALIARLQDAGARVVAASRKRVESGGGVEWIAFDSRSHVTWQSLIDRADVIFHLAGNTSVYEAERQPDVSYASTVEPIELIAAAAQRAGRKPRVVFASTATVYGLTDSQPVDERTRPEPITTYDRHKLEAERRLIHSPDLDAIALRLANVYGPSVARSGANERGFLNRAVEQAWRGRDVDIYGDGRYLRDYVYIDDVIEAFLLAGVAAAADERCLNIGSGSGITLRDAVAMAIARVAHRGRAVAMREIPWPADAHAIERRNFVANIDRARAVLGWQPAVGLDTGIARLADALAAAEVVR